MAGNFTRNTVGVPGLSQVVVAYDDGTAFDYIAQNAAGTVVIADTRKQAVARGLKVGGVAVLNET